MPILIEADALIHGERKAAYGNCFEEYTRLAKMVNAALGAKLKEPLTAEDMLLFMVLLKINRLVTNQEHRDSLVDAAGYLGCIEDAQVERKRRVGEPPEQ